MIPDWIPFSAKRTSSNVYYELDEPFEDVSRTKMSGVWKYFLKSKSSEKAKCGICSAIYKIKNGQTSSLINHLKKHFIFM